MSEETYSDHEEIPVSDTESEDITATGNEDIVSIILGDALNDHIVFLTGSTPKLVADKIELSAEKFSKNRILAKDFLAVLCICSIGHRRTLEDYMTKKAGVSLKPFMDDNFKLNDSYNFSALNVAGHCILAACGKTDNSFIKETRKRMGGDHIWTAVFSSGSCTEKQISIFNQRKAALSRRDAIIAGKRILTIVFAPFLRVKKTPVVDIAEQGDGDASNIVITKGKENEATTSKVHGKKPITATDKSKPSATDATSDKLMSSAMAAAEKLVTKPDNVQPQAIKTVADMFPGVDKSAKKRKGPPVTDKTKKILRTKLNNLHIKFEEGESDGDYLIRLSNYIAEFAKEGYTAESLMEGIQLAATLNGVDPGSYLPDGSVIVMNDKDFEEFFKARRAAK